MSRRFFNWPMRTTVIVRGLPHLDMVIESKAVAWLRQSPSVNSTEREAEHAG
jgi:hypothetical protein